MFGFSFRATDPKDMAQIHCLRAQLDEHHNNENRIDQLIDECKREFTRLSEDHEACQSYPFLPSLPSLYISVI